MDTLFTVQDVLEAMVLVAVMVNAALIGMSGVMDRLVPGLSDVSMVLLLVSVEVRLHHLLA